MVKEIEREGVPVAQVCTMVNVATAMGANRVVPSSSVLYPTGDPARTDSEEVKRRRQLVGEALQAIATQVERPTVIEAQS